LLPASRKGTRWLDVLKVLAANRLIAPSSEWRVHREWFDSSAMGDLLGCGAEVSAKDPLNSVLDRLLKHKEALFGHLRTFIRTSPDEQGEARLALLVAAEIDRTADDARIAE
jgi:hypothetical protein